MTLPVSAPVFFATSEYWGFYAAFIVFVLVVLAVDLGLFHREAHTVKLKEAALWSTTWVTLALLFCYGLYRYIIWKVGGDPQLIAQWGDPETIATQFSLEFLTGYIVEQALSVDNLFIFVLVFQYFAIPSQYQHRILFYGILGAIIFRGIFIALGAILMQFHFVVMLFGIFLIATGIKLFFTSEKPLNPEANPIIRLLKRFLPITSAIEDQSFFQRKNGVIYGTPLLIVLVFVELSDIVFAVDSVPAIYAITKEPFIVFTSNVFAILGLRSLYFLLAAVMDRFYLLKYGLGIVLVFVGLKMVWLDSAYGGKFPVTWSLGIIALVVAGSVVLSLIFPKKDHSGAGIVG